MNYTIKDLETVAEQRPDMVVNVPVRRYLQFLKMAEQMRSSASVALNVSDIENKSEVFANMEQVRLLNTSIFDAGFNVRVTNVFSFNDIKTVGDITKKTEKELCKLRNFGKRSLREVKMYLKSVGLKLKG